MGRSPSDKFAYQAVYRYLENQLDVARRSGQLRLPSLRSLARGLRVSLGTVQFAYGLLEHEGRVVSIPKSGYFVRVDEPIALGPGAALSAQGGTPTFPQRALLTHERRLARQQIRRWGPAPSVGGEQLRNSVAKRYTRCSGHPWHAENVHLGPDVQAVLETLLPALGLRGATALVASPCCWRLLAVLQALDMRVLEVPCKACGQLDLLAMAQLLADEPIRLVVMPSCLGMPQGRLSTPQEQRAIAGLLADRQLWLLENDLDSELCFSTPPKLRLRDLVDPRGLLVLGSLSVTAGAEAPYAYVLSRHAEAGRAFNRRAFELAPLRQQALACLLSKGEADAHLRGLRGDLQWRMDYLCQQLWNHCAECLSFEPPQGGGVVWVRMRQAQAVGQAQAALAGSALQALPGDWFSVQGGYSQWLALAWLGEHPGPLNEALQRLARALAPRVDG